MDLLNELLQFLNELKQYREILTNPDSKLLEAKRKDELFAGFPFLQDTLPKKSKEDVIEELREHLVRKTGKLKASVIELTGKENITRFNNVFNIWDTGLSNHRVSDICDVALDYCIDSVNEAIGKLEEKQKNKDEESLIDLFNEEPRKVNQQPNNKTIAPPKAFIAHEGKTRALAALREFLEALGIQYFLAESNASDGRSVEKQVDWTQSKTDFAICLATKGKAINKKTGKPYMGLNIADELGRARAIFKNKIILLLEEDVEPHTNISEIVHERFTTQSMDKAFTKIAKELRNWGVSFEQGRLKE